MPQLPTIHCTLLWSWEDADGSVCRFCGDEIWLRQLRPWIDAGGIRTPIPQVFCESCGEILLED